MAMAFSDGSLGKFITGKVKTIRRKDMVSRGIEIMMCMTASGKIVREKVRLYSEME